MCRFYNQNEQTFADAGKFWSEREHLSGSKNLQTTVLNPPRHLQWDVASRCTSYDPLGPECAPRTIMMTLPSTEQQLADLRVPPVVEDSDTSGSTCDEVRAAVAWLDDLNDAADITPPKRPQPTTSYERNRSFGPSMSGRDKQEGKSFLDHFDAPPLLHILTPALCDQALVQYFNRLFFEGHGVTKAE